MLIILAGVSLSLVLNNGSVLRGTKDGGKEYINASKNELATLDSYDQFVEDQTKESTGTTPAYTNIGTTTNPAGRTPTGATVIEADGNKGITIEDANGNEWVWVEVPKTAEVYPTAGLGITGFSDAEYTAIETDLHTYTSTYRGSTSYTDTYYSDAQTGLTSTQYTTTKKAMLKSIYQNGGFWVGRYEAGIKEDTVRYFGTDYNTEHATTGQTPVIQANKIPYTWVRCNQAETLAKALAPSGYNSSLLFGVQWDLVLRYLESKGATQAELKTNSTSWGNYYNNLYNITSTLAKYSTNAGSSWTATPYNETGNGSTLLTTGATSTFSKNNIYDIAGNVWEWTMERTSNSSSPCAGRGGSCDNLGSGYPASGRGYNIASDSYGIIGFRVTLY